MSGQFTILFVLAVAVCGLSNAVDYCSISSCKGKVHTCCKYDTTEAGSKCKTVLSVGLSNAEKKQILHVHNELRQKVASGKETLGNPGPQPAASNMATLEWDDELEMIAQRWANQCNWGHDSCRNVEGATVGQNIAYHGTTGSISNVNAADMVKDWYNEVQDFDKNQVSNFQSGSSTNGKQVGHYTQLVWAKTTKLGCGGMRYNDGKFNKFYLVCNYSPAGNYLGEPLYKIKA